MTRRRDNPDERPKGDSRHDARPAPSFDPLALATLAGVVGVLMLTFASWRDVSRMERSLDERLGKLAARLEQVASRPVQQALQRGPNPSRVYSDGAPARGGESAPVTIAEFSDFQ